jgi:hypothetical protein
VRRLRKVIDQSAPALNLGLPDLRIEIGAHEVIGR